MTDKIEMPDKTKTPDKSKFDKLAESVDITLNWLIPDEKMGYFWCTISNNNRVSSLAEPVD